MTKVFYSICRLQEKDFTGALLSVPKRRHLRGLYDRLGFIR